MLPRGQDSGENPKGNKEVLMKCCLEGKRPQGRYVFSNLYILIINLYFKKRNVEQNLYQQDLYS